MIIGRFLRRWLRLHGEAARLLGSQKIFDRPKRSVSEAGVLENVTGNVTENVTENASSLAELFNVTERTIKRDLSKLQTLGLLKHEGPDKGGKWLVLIQLNDVRQG